jgi:hypothetical protein
MGRHPHESDLVRTSRRERKQDLEIEEEAKKRQLFLLF